VKAIAAGWYHTVALKDDGTLVAWGFNITGQTTVPAGLSGVKAIAAGYGHTIALKEDGTVVAWGDSSLGQTTVPAGLSGVIAIAAGSYYTVALKEDSTLVAWGDSALGQTAVPAGLSGVVAIAAGNGQTVALLNKPNTLVKMAKLQSSLPHISLSFRAGRCIFSTPLSAGTIFTLIDLNGRVLFRANVQGTSFKLPLCLAGRVAIWRIENSKLSTSGKLMLKQRAEVK
jgi:hypothetical protein